MAQYLRTYTKRLVLTVALATLISRTLAQETIELNGETGILDETPHDIHNSKTTTTTRSGSPIQPGIEALHPAFEDDLYLGYWGNYALELEDEPTQEPAKNLMLDFTHAILSNPPVEFNVLTMEAPDASALPLEETDWSTLFKSSNDEDMQGLLQDKIEFE